MKNGAVHEIVTFGLNAYYWGDPEQDFLLAEGLGPILREADLRWDLARIWYDRGTMRGPHIFCLLTSRSDQAAAAMEFLRAKIAVFIQRHPSNCPLTADQLAALHRDASGKAFCMADLAEGMAGNNELLVFFQENAEQHYPFRLCSDSRAEAVWRAWKKAAFWILRQIESAESLEASAVWFLLACDHLFFKTADARKEYWGRHIGTLIPNLDRHRLSGEHVQAMACRLVSPQSMERIAAWREQISSADRPPQAEELLAIISQLQSQIAQPLGRDQALLRELIHVSLKQLGIHVVRQIPMIFTVAALSWPQSKIQAGVS
ncbi:MAG: hypothetical protein LAO76_01425 [Acidobacteriia bacterium]|nr:hypothetical protein [Terriglobia bacterium]